MKSMVVAATLLMLILDASALGAQPQGSAAGGNLPSSALGMNIYGDAEYFNVTFPFLNLVKQAAPGWSTGNISGETGEQGYLALDANGYPTSLVCNGCKNQKFNYVHTLLIQNPGGNDPYLAPGARHYYQPGTYRLKFIGRGTVSVGFDAKVDRGNSCGPGASLSNDAANTYVSCTFNVDNPSPGGLVLNITAIRSSTDYPRDISVVYQPYVASYDAGAIFNPQFLAMLAPFSGLRFMDWMGTNGEFGQYSATGPVAAGATTLTLSKPWTEHSGVHEIMFIDGERRQAMFTFGSAAVSWSGGLSNAIAQVPGAWARQQFWNTFWMLNYSWARRAHPASAFWTSSAGWHVPIEVIVALCNTLNANCYLNVPVMFSDADIRSFGALVMTGTGMEKGFNGLKANLTASFELSNEVWNSGFQQYGAVGVLGGVRWPGRSPGGGNSSWLTAEYSYRTAHMAQDLQTGTGAAFSRVIPVLGAQAAYDGWARGYLGSNYWSGMFGSLDLTTYPIKAIAIAPYWGGYPSDADCARMTGQKDRGLADFFATLHSQTGASGAVYSSVPQGGWLGQVQGWVSAYTHWLRSSYPSLKLMTYEGGQNFIANGGCRGWPELVKTANRDPRMGAAYLDSMNWWKQNVGASPQNIYYQYADVAPQVSNGSWGALESIMQWAENPSPAVTPKYQSLYEFAHQ